jgi:Spy/CpxP family protein refolding chaperone
VGPGMAGGPKCGPMLKALDLTAEQQKKSDAIHEKQARQMVQAEADMRIAEMDMQQLMSAETLDKAKIDAQIDKLSQLRAGMQKSRIATLFEIRALLTPEQLKKFSVGPLMGGGEEDD